MKKNLELFEETMLWAPPVGLLSAFAMKQEWKVLDSHTVLSWILAFSVANMRTRIRILSRFFNQPKIWHELWLLPSPAPYRIHCLWWKIVKVDHGSLFDKDYTHSPCVISSVLSCNTMNIFIYTSSLLEIIFLE